MSRALRPLRLVAFRRLAAAHTVNEFGDWLGMVALAILVFDQTGSALASATLFLAMKFLPSLAAPLLVARFDTADPRRALSLIYALEGLAFVVLALVSGSFVLALVCALAAADGLLALFGRALSRSTAAAVLDPSGELRAGNALINVGFTAAAAAGPATAGLVVAGFGVEVALLLDAASFFAVAGLLATVSLPRAEPPAEAGWRRRALEGLAYVRERPALRRLVLAQAAAFVFFAITVPIDVVYAKETLAAGDTGFGLLLAAWGVGMVGGSLLFAAAARVPLPALLVTSTSVIALAYFGLAVAPSLAVACLASLLGGAGNGVQWVALMSAVQELTAPRFQARVVSLLESVGAAMPGVGFLAGGAIAALVSARASYFLAGLGLVTVIALAAPLVARSTPAGPSLEPQPAR